MNKLGTGLLIAAGVIGATAVGTSYVVGGKIEQQVQQTSRSWSRQGMHIQLVNYQRGIVHSTAETLWTLEGSPSRRDLEAVEDGSLERPVHGNPIILKAIHQISHGPWPAGKAAQIRTQFYLQPGADPQLLAALKEQPILNWETKFSWNRSSTHTSNAPTLAWQQAGTAIQWGGMQAQWQMPPDMQGMQGSASFPALRLESSATEHLQVQDTALRFDVRRTPEHLWLTGPLEISIASLQRQAEGPPTQLTGLTFETQSDLIDQTAKLQLKLRLAGIQTQGLHASDLAVDLGLHNIDADWLDQWLQGQDSDIDMEQADPGTGTETDADSWTRSLPAQLELLLASKPELQLQRLSLRTPQGVSEIKASLAFIGDPERSFNPLQDLVTRVEASLPKVLLQDLLAQKLQSSLLADLEDTEERAEVLGNAQQEAAALIAQLVQQGVIKAEAEQLKAQIAFGEGRVELNHQALDANAAAQLIANLFQ